MKKSPSDRLINLDKYCFYALLKSKKKEIKIKKFPYFNKYYSGKVQFKENNGNYFEYETIGQNQYIANPKINFKIFSGRISKEKIIKFKKHLLSEYERVLNEIQIEIDFDEDIKDVIESVENRYKKNLYIKTLKDLKISYQPHMEEYRDIYNKYHNRFNNLPKNEKEFLKEFGLFKITRESAFYILLFRHKDDEDFLIKDVNIYDQTNLKDKFEKFIKSYDKHLIITCRKKPTRVGLKSKF